MTVGERVKQLRKAKGLTLEKFGSSLGISAASISGIELGKNGASNSTIKAICAVYGVSEDWLRTGEGEMFEELDPDEELMRFVAQITKDDNDPLCRLARILAQLPPEGIEAVRTAIRYLLISIHAPREGSD